MQWRKAGDDGSAGGADPEPRPVGPVPWQPARPHGFGATTPDGFTLAVFLWADDLQAGTPAEPWGFEVQSRAPAAFARRHGTARTAMEARRKAEAALHDLRRRPAAL